MTRIIVTGILAFLGWVHASTYGILPVRNDPINSDIKIQKIISKRQVREYTIEAYPTNKCPSGQVWDDFQRNCKYGLTSYSWTKSNAPFDYEDNSVESQR